MNLQSIANFRKAAPLLAVLLTAAILAGCGNGSPTAKADGDTSQTATAVASPDSLGSTSTAGSDRKPCEYMARADAEAAVGQPLPKTTENIPLGMCDYNTPEFYGASLTVSSWEAIKNAATSGSPQHQPTPISGVGDEALNLGGLLYVRKGNQGFLLTLNGPNIDHLADHGLEKEKALALKILPNL